MCNSNLALVIFLIFKIIVLIILPIIVFILYKFNHKLFNTVGVVNILFIIILILLRLFGNDCVKNSNFSYFKKTNKEVNIIKEDNSVRYSVINSTKTYPTINHKNAYFYDINSVRLKDYKLSCDNNSYISNYGSGISAITTLIANKFDIEVNEVNVIKYLEENNLLDCDDGFDFDNSLIKLGDKYYYNVYQIYANQVDSYVSNGNSVLVETSNKYNNDNNFGCEKDYIVIYSKNNEGNYSIINPNDKNYSYFCPSNTIGYGSIIEKDQNKRTFTLDEITNKALRYFVIEVK